MIGGNFYGLERIDCSMLSADGVAGELGKAKLSEKPIQVLGGRLTIRMPEGAKIEARTPNIMSAPEAEEHDTVAPGTKKLQLAAGERRLFAFSKALEISVMVPANTVATKQVGPDFLVHRLIILGRLGADSGSMGIYIGVYPNLKPGAKKGVGVMFGKKIEWQSFTEGQGVETLCELSIPGDPHLVAHLWVRAPSDSQLQALKQAAESMKLVEVKKPGSN
jgi:hypothetical protein